MAPLNPRKATRQHAADYASSQSQSEASDAESTDGEYIPSEFQLRKVKPIQGRGKSESDFMQSIRHNLTKADDSIIKECRKFEKKQANKALALTRQHEQRTAESNAACMKKLMTRGVETEEDHEVRVRIKSFIGNMKNWSKKFAPQGRLGSLDDLQQTQILESLATGMLPAISQSKGLRASCQDLQIKIIVNALLTKHIFGTLLHENIFFLDDPDLSRRGIKLGEALDDFYRLAKIVDKDLANNWRSETIKVLHPGPAKRSNLESEGKDLVECAKAKKYRMCAESFIQDGKLQLLFKELGESKMTKALGDLETIVEETGNYLLRLGTQQVRVKPFAYDRLQPLNGNILKGLVKLHPSILDKSIDISGGLPMLSMVVVPAIVAYGDGEGKGYDEYKVWSSAMVWIATETRASEQAGTVTKTLSLHENDSVHPTIEESVATGIGDQAEQKNSKPEGELCDVTNAPASGTDINPESSKLSSTETGSTAGNDVTDFQASGNQKHTSVTSHRPSPSFHEHQFKTVDKDIEVIVIDDQDDIPTVSGTSGSSGMAEVEHNDEGWGKRSAEDDPAETVSKKPRVDHSTQEGSWNEFNCAPDASTTIKAEGADYVSEDKESDEGLVSFRRSYHMLEIGGPRT